LPYRFAVEGTIPGETMFRAIAAAAAFGLFIATPAFAVSVSDCNDNVIGNVRNIAEPWEKNTRAFYDGHVRVALIDTGGEPICCSMHLLVLAPSVPEVEGMDQYRNCFMVHNEGEIGFQGIDFARITSRYDAGKGLLITFPYTLYNEGNPGKHGVGRVRVNMQKGTVLAE
jgi:hypothetical protein